MGNKAFFIWGDLKEKATKRKPQLQKVNKCHVPRRLGNSKFTFEYLPNFDFKRVISL